MNKLAETVSNLYLETSPQKDHASMGARVYPYGGGRVKESAANVIVDERDLDALAKVVSDLS